MKPEERLLDALALAEDEADDLARARVEADPALRTEAEALGRVVTRLRAVEPALPPPTLRGSILAALEAEAGPAPAPTRGWWGSILRLGLVGAAAAVLIGVGVGGGGLGQAPIPPAPHPRVLLAAWQGPGQAPTELGAGAVVRIPEGARATLDWRGRGPLELAGGTVAVLEEHAVQLVTGTVVSGIDPEDDVGFRVRTEDAVVSVVGTRFRVTFERERGTEVEVFEGEVRVEDLRTQLVRILTPALRAVWQAWNVEGDEPPRPRPPPATRPADRPPPPPPSEPPSTERLPGDEPPVEAVEAPSLEPADPMALEPGDDTSDDASDDASEDDEDEAVSAKPGDEPDETDEPEDPSFVPADTVEGGF